MQEAPPGLRILETRHQGPVRVVFSAEQLPLGRKVQLVGLAPGVLTSSPLARALEHEGEVLAKLDHPNILKLYDLKRSESELWLVLEEVTGPLLSELGDARLSYEAIAALGLDLARALSHAHELGETHGRLELSSVQLTKQGRTKLSGFGRVLPSQSSEVEALEPNSSGGLSPEASVGRRASPLSDLFALGCVLYELLTREAPFGAADSPHYAERVRNETPRPIQATRPGAPQALVHLVEQCLQKVPAERPESARAVAARLEEIVSPSTMPVIAAELAAIFAGEERASLVPGAKRPSHFSSHRPFRSKHLPLFAAGFAGILLGAGLYFWLARAPEKQSKSVSADATVTADALLLRVVATPWAHVLVDGEHRETTPFATPLALSPGKHLVRLEHPHAKAEERIVSGGKGQAILLNVQMHVKRPLTLDEAEPVAEESTP